MAHPKIKSVKFNLQKYFGQRIAVSLALALIATVFSRQANAVTAYEAPPGGWVESSFGLSASTEYFMSQANYENARGSYSRLPGDNKFSSLESKFRGRYNFTTLFSAFAGFGLGYSQATDSVYQKSNSQLTEAFAGADFLLNKKYVRLVPEVLVSMPMSPTDPNQTDPLTSDGVPYIRTGLFAHKPLRYFRLGAFGGFHIPLSDLGTRFAYEVTADMRLFTVVTIGGGINGYETFLADSSTFASRNQTALRANAGSQRFFAFEPSLIEARGWVGFRPDRSMWIRVGVAKTLNGINTAEGFALTGSIVFNSSPLIPTKNSKSSERPDEVSAKQNFVPDSEDMDQDLFENQEAEILPKSGEDDLDQTEKLLEKKARP